MLLAAWEDGDDVVDAFRRSVAAVEGGADPAKAARKAGNGGRREMVGAILQTVAQQMPAARAEAERGSRLLRELRAANPSELDAGDLWLLAQHAKRDADDLESWAFGLAVGRARAAAFAWENDGPRGYDATTSDATRRAWSDAALALGRRLGGRCLDCGAPLAGLRATGSTGRTARRDYCAAHERAADDYAQGKREKEIERLTAEISRALRLNLV